MLLSVFSVFLSLSFTFLYLQFFTISDCEQTLYVLATAIPSVVAPMAGYPYAKTIHEVDCLRARLDNLAKNDELTQVPNRRYFTEQAELILKRACRLQEPIVLMFIDADFFKKVNDVHGHGAGDTVLKALANNLRGLTRDYDLIGRYGGEEFLVLLPNTSQKDGLMIAERIRSYIEKTPIDIGDKMLNITVSIGISCQSGNLLSLKSLTEQADLGVYAAKDAGRNCIKEVKHIDSV